MIDVKRLVSMVRYKQKDNNEIRFSDYDILEALNECIRYLNQRFSLCNADFLERLHCFVESKINEQLVDGEELVDFAITGVELPEDFLVLVSIVRATDGYSLKAEEAIRQVGYDTYKIVGNRLYCGAKAINMLYRGTVLPAKSMDDVVQLPDMLMDGLVKCTGMILNNTTETDVLAQAVDKNIVSLIVSRRYSNVKVKMPFYC